MKVGQQNVQKELRVFPRAVKKKYKGKKPEKDRRDESLTEQMEVMEENDYAGVRSVPPDYLVTEKGTAKKDKKDKKRSDA